jgi:hypothetical protein
VPHSVFTGRPTPTPGEPLFLEEDTAAALALAEEERDTCPSCGLPKAWCRDPKAQFGAFEAHEDTCFATYALAVHRKGVDEKRSDETRVATQTSVRFAAGREPDIEAGLELDALDDGRDAVEDAEDR